MAHWYTKEGVLIPDANLRQARKHGLVPSVTTITNILKKDGLQQWKDEQLLMSAITDTKKPEETDKEFISRIIENSKQISVEAMDFGTIVHNIIERLLRRQDIDLSQYEDKRIKPVHDAMFTFIMNNELVGDSEVSRVFGGYAGTIDFVGNSFDGSVIIDWKTQGVSREEYKTERCKDVQLLKYQQNINGKFLRPKPKWYPDWIFQLAAYRMMLPKLPDKTMSVIINSDPEYPGEVFFKEWSAEEIDHGTDCFLTMFELFKHIKKIGVGYEI